jgi:hypothetical protein
MNILRLEDKSTGDKILSAYGVTPILKMIVDNQTEAHNWLVVFYEDNKSVVPVDSWKAIRFYNKIMETKRTVSCPDCFDGIMIDGTVDSYGADAFESTCTTCNGSGKIKNS